MATEAQVQIENQLIETPAERKAAKALLKLGLTPVYDITRVTMQRLPNLLFTWDKPKIYKAKETYFIFGEFAVSDLTAKARQAQMQLAEHNKYNNSPLQDTPDEAEEESIDETDLVPADIDLIIEQTGCSRAKAATALKKSNGDVVNAIMEIS